MNIKKIMPDPKGRLSVFTNNLSIKLAIEGKPGIIPSTITPTTNNPRTSDEATPNNDIFSAFLKYIISASAGIATRLSRWTPIDNPIMYAINNIHLFWWDASLVLSHLSIAQNTKAVKNEDIAYTSASTAENQKESVKVKDNAPVKPDSKTNRVLLNVLVFMIFDVRWVIVQKRNNMVKALDKTLKKLIASAIFSRFPNAKNEKNLPSSK